jgi:hypothetical protein
MDKKLNQDSIYQNAFLLLDNNYNIKDDENALLFDKLTYIIFCIAILPNNNYSLALLNEFSRIYLSIKDKDNSWSFTPEFINLINNSFYKLKEIFPLKRGVKVIAEVLRKQLVNEPFKNGIEFGILDKIIDLKNMSYSLENIPYHSRIGLGQHSGTIANEEQQLLDDSFFMLINAENEYSIMISLAKEFEKDRSKDRNKDSEKAKEILNRLNRNVCTYCRNGIANFFNFFETFLNNLGNNFLYENENLISDEDKLLLKENNNYYLKLEVKIENLQRIIGKKIIYKTNSHQELTEECFTKLLNRFKEQGGASTYFSKGKGNILSLPNTCLADLKDISKYSLEASKKLWKACYKQKDYPNYLMNLEYNALYKEAKMRVDFKCELIK